MEISLCCLSAFLTICQKEHSDLLSKKILIFYLMTTWINPLILLKAKNWGKIKKKKTQALEFIIFSISWKYEPKNLNQVLSYAIDYTVQFFLRGFLLMELK